MQNVNVSNETTIEKQGFRLFISYKMHETFLGIKRMARISEKQ